MKGKTGYPAGELLWKYTFPSANRIISSPALFDFNKDGMQDAVFGGEDGTIHIFDGFAGKRETGRILAAVKASNAAITSSVALGDADGDGMMEVVYGDIADSLQVLRTNAKVFKARVYWPMFLGDAAHASSGSPDQAGPYIIMVMSSLVALIILALVEIMLKKRQLTKRPRVVYIYFFKLFRRRSVKVTYFAKTDAGKVRRENQDSYAILESENLFAVYDGMGGGAAGDAGSARDAAGSA